MDASTVSLLGGWNTAEGPRSESREAPEKAEEERCKWEEKFKWEEARGEGGWTVGVESG